MNIASTIDAARTNDTRAIGRLISAVENDAEAARVISRILVQKPSDHKAHIIGITGAPGVGKSTCLTALIGAFRERGMRVGVLAVDPSSPFTKGALLGDRVRMQQFATDRDVYIRSMAARGHLGGLAVAAPQALRLLEAVGFQIVIVETVGVGQGEVEIANLADTTLLLLAPGMGDGIQAVKAGVVEIADVFVVNKADHNGADATVRDVKNMLGLGGKHSAPGTWRPHIVKTVAARAANGGRDVAKSVDEGGAGISELLTIINKHYEWLSSHDQLHTIRVERARAEIEALVTINVRHSLNIAALNAYANDVAAGSMDAYAAADALRSPQR